MKNTRSQALLLKGRVALVAGATRGACRGIARAFAEAGATVYCTGRSVEGKPSPYRRPERGRHKIDFSTLPAEWIDLFRTASDLEVKWLTTLALRTKKFRTKIPSLEWPRRCSMIRATVPPKLT